MAKMLCLRQKSMKVMNEGKIIPGTAMTGEWAKKKMGYWRAAKAKETKYWPRAYCNADLFRLKIQHGTRANERLAARELKVFAVTSIAAFQIVGPGGRTLLDWFKEIKIKISAAATSERILISKAENGTGRVPLPRNLLLLLDRRRDEKGQEPKSTDVGRDRHGVPTSSSADDPSERSERTWNVGT
ncbi:hypothetical protein K438DRAFT_1770379 [Mycena galopus ATCC 62051]|nr:hypothetical protein K438DRAFT_1770379 [Mycena galopus ATCC 62051]